MVDIVEISVGFNRISCAIVIDNRRRPALDDHSGCVESEVANDARRFDRYTFRSCTLERCVLAFGMELERLGESGQYIL